MTEVRQRSEEHLSDDASDSSMDGEQENLLPNAHFINSRQHEPAPVDRSV